MKSAVTYMKRYDSDYNSFRCALPNFFLSIVTFKFLGTYKVMPWKNFSIQIKSRNSFIFNVILY